MVRDGIYYGLAMAAVAVLIGVWTTPLLAVVPALLGVFFLWFFRDPEREIPDTAGAVVSPADGVVTGILATPVDGEPHTSISIFLNVFNVHVNRAPAAGVITRVEYRRGKYLNAMNPASAEQNEQNICTMRTAEGQPIIFKQIAGLLARRIVFRPKVGDTVARGERIGLIKFGSRCDLIVPAGAKVTVKVGDKVKGGSSILAVLPGGEH
jgi:phosphatidylserine decarboxylase